MQAPRQKCGSDHWLNQPCPRGECRQLGVTDEDRVEAKEVLRAVKSQTKSAERQRRYRERHRDEYRERNKLRMRRKRGG